MLGAVKGAAGKGKGKGKGKLLAMAAAAGGSLLAGEYLLPKLMDGGEGGSDAGGSDALGTAAELAGFAPMAIGLGKRAMPKIGKIGAKAGVIDDFNLYSKTGLIVLYTYFQIPLGVLLLYPAFDALRQDWRESAQLLGAGTWDFWRHIGLPVLTPALLGTFVILLANALGAYATVYYLTTGNFNVMPIRIAGLVAGDISLDPNLASALAMVLVGLMALITVVHQWLLRRSYHDAR